MSTDWSLVASTGFFPVHLVISLFKVETTSGSLVTRSVDLFPSLKLISWLLKSEGALTQTLMNRSTIPWSLWSLATAVYLPYFRLNPWLLESEEALTPSLIESLNDSLIPVNVHIPFSYPLIILCHLPCDIAQEFTPRINLKYFRLSQWSTLINCLKSLWNNW